MLHHLADALAFFFPAICPLCEYPAETEWGVCLDCDAAMPWFEPPWCSRCGRPLDAGGSSDAVCTDCATEAPVFRRAFSVLPYEPAVQRAVTRLKYGRDATLAPALAMLFQRIVPAPVLPFEYDWVTAVPLHPKRLRWRGFNQALLLADSLTSTYGLRLGRTLVTRPVATRTQASLDRAGRIANLARAFAVPKPAVVKGKNVLVVDDVMTTGMTLQACAAALLEAGAASVDCLTIARALPNRGP